jgi:RNA polymerase sigma-54 factor
MLDTRLSPELRPEHRIDQRLITQMNLLVRNHMELASIIDAELASNPLLEREPDFDLPAVRDFLRDRSTAPATAEWKQDDYSKADRLTKGANLWERLERQIGEIRMKNDVRAACLLIIQNLNDDGYFPCADIPQFASENALAVDLVQSALSIVQGLDPAGVAARDLRECLMLQLRQLGEQTSVAYRILEQCFELLVKNDSIAIARRLNVEREVVVSAQARIRKLDPHPGLKLNNDVAEPAVPEVRIELKSGVYVVTAIEERTPRVRMNPVYLRMLDQETLDAPTRKYLAERIAAASQLLWNLQSRGETIVAVCESIVRRQRPFFDGRSDHPSPMLMLDVAVDVGIHAATVSRAVAHKFAETPRGILALRSLFSPVSAGAGDVSIEAVRAKIRNIIETEDPTEPLSDDHIARRLASEGLRIARRRVSAHREELRLPSARQRRVLAAR